jgi:hypothetical protein
MVHSRAIDSGGQGTGSGFRTVKPERPDDADVAQLARKRKATTPNALKICLIRRSLLVFDPETAVFGFFEDSLPLLPPTSSC